MKFSKLALVLAAVAVVLGVSTPADAAFRLRVTDSLGNGVVLTDNGAGDLDGNTNAIAFLGTIGAFTMNFTAGISTSVPNTTVPGMYDAIDVVSLNVSSAVGGTLQIILEQTGFGNAPDGSIVLTQLIGGTLSGAVGTNVTFRGWANDDDQVPDLGPDGTYVLNAPAVTGLPPGMGNNSVVTNSVAITTQSPIGFNVGSSTGFTKSGPYSLFSEALVTIVGGGSVSFDHLTGTTPAPAGLLLFAAAVPALALAVRRKKAAQA